jgi:dihydroorotate dehydrogenase electron transfer subunit
MLSLMRQSLGLDRYGDASTPAPWATRVVFCYGARSASGFSCLDDFSSLPIDLRLATEDGTKGMPGRVTDALTAAIQEYGTERSRIACCGPEPMMEAVAHLAAQHAMRCQVSLETPMACGIGICFTCVAKVGTPSDWDYRRTCIEGPVFDADQVVW